MTRSRSAYHLSDDAKARIARLQADGDLEGTEYEWGFAACDNAIARDEGTSNAWREGWDDAQHLDNE